VELISLPLQILLDINIAVINGRDWCRYLQLWSGG